MSGPPFSNSLARESKKMSSQQSKEKKCERKGKEDVFTTKQGSKKHVKEMIMVVAFTTKQGKEKKKKKAWWSRLPWLPGPECYVCWREHED